MPRVSGLEIVLRGRLSLNLFCCGGRMSAEQECASIDQALRPLLDFVFWSPSSANFGAPENTSYAGALLVEADVAVPF